MNLIWKKLCSKGECRKKLNFNLMKVQTFIDQLGGIWSRLI